jgi:hypothetical protein
MADTKQLHDVPPVEGDGIHYPGIRWFVVVLVGVTAFCQLLTWGMFEFSQWRANRAEPPRAAVAAPVTTPEIRNGTLFSESIAPRNPVLLVTEPFVLQQFREQERAALEGYGWVDQAAQQVRLPIDRAKDLLIERGLPVRAGAPAASPASVSGSRDTGTGASSTATGSPATGDAPQGAGIPAGARGGQAPSTSAPAAAGRAGGH